MTDSSNNPEHADADLGDVMDDDTEDGGAEMNGATDTEAETATPEGESIPDIGPAMSEEDGELQARYDQLNDRHLRLAAEFNNYRRRSEAERLEVWARAQADLMERLLDVLDDLSRVADLDLSNATVEAIMEGIDLVERKFNRVLADVGMEVIDPVDADFDPERMEAMMRVPTDSEEQDDVVAQVFQKGYSLKGILVRPARVSVHKHG